MVTAWSKWRSALRKWTSTRSPTSAWSVGPGMRAGPTGRAKPSDQRWKTKARKRRRPRTRMPIQSSRPVGAKSHTTERAWIQYVRTVPPGAGAGREKLSLSTAAPGGRSRPTARRSLSATSAAVARDIGRPLSVHSMAAAPPPSDRKARRSSEGPSIGSSRRKGPWRLPERAGTLPTDRCYVAHHVTTPDAPQRARRLADRRRRRRARPGRKAPPEAHGQGRRRLLRPGEADQAQARRVRHPRGLPLAGGELGHARRQVHKDAEARPPLPLTGGHGRLPLGQDAAQARHLPLHLHLP